MKTLALGSLVVWAALTGTALVVSHNPCPTEDSTACYWDGSTRGNKTGESFVALTESVAIVWDSDEL